MSLDLFVELAVISACLAIGGLLKGATGAGAPILAVPALAAYVDVRFAIVVMMVPNVTTNLWQAWHYRRHMPELGLLLPLIAGGIPGIAAGTLFLKALPAPVLEIVAACAVFGYLALRLLRPGWRLTMETAKALAMPAGLAAGVLQGASGISAPISITFLNALRMGREAFIAGISLFFVAFTAAQILAVAASGLIMPGDIYYGLFALVPITLAMPLGARIVRRIPPQWVDRLVLAILFVLGIKLFADGLLAA